MTFFKNLYAEIYIFINNFIADFGGIINMILLIIILGIIVTGVARAISAGRSNRKGKPIKMHQPDPELTLRAAENLSGAIKFKTVTGETSELEKLRAYLRECYPTVFARAYVTEIPGGGLLICWRSGEKNDRLPVMLTGHLDVVPEGTGWNGDPFSGERVDGKIIGRGTLDGKNVVIAMLEALNSLIEEEYVPRRDIYFALGHDEESGGYEGAKTIGEILQKRGIKFDFILNDGGYIAKAHMGSKLHPAALIGVAEKASCYYRITASGVLGQTDQPPRKTAIGSLSEAVCRIETSFPRHRLLPVVEDYLKASTYVMSFGKRLAISNLPFSAPFLNRIFCSDRKVSAMLHSTFVPTMAEAGVAQNVMPGSAEAIIHARLLQGDTPASALDYMRSLVSDLDVKIELIKGRNPSRVASSKSPLYQALESSIVERFAHLHCIPTVLTSSTDCRHYEELSENIVRFMPFVVSDTAHEAMHGPNEYVRENSLGMAVEIYRSFMKKL